MKITPWFSTEEKEHAEDVSIHHDNTSCKIGGGIGKNHRRYGTDNRPLCKQCAKLDAAGR